MLYIYLTTNLVNGKRYVGQHHGKLNDSYIGSGVVLLEAIAKYGKENFKKEILEICESQKDLDEKEIYWINYYNAVKDPNFYNIAEGGLGGNKFVGKSDEWMADHKKKLSERIKGKNNPNYGGVFVGEKHPMYGKHHSEESKQKMREAKIGKTLTEEHKKKISENSKEKKQIDMYDLNNNYIQRFESLRAVNIFLGLSPKSTYRLNCAMKENKPYHGYFFKRVVENNI